LEDLEIEGDLRLLPWGDLAGDDARRGELHLVFEVGSDRGGQRWHLRHHCLGSLRRFVAPRRLHDAGDPSDERECGEKWGAHQEIYRPKRQPRTNRQRAVGTWPWSVVCAIQ